MGKEKYSDEVLRAINQEDLFYIDKGSLSQVYQCSIEKRNIFHFAMNVHICLYL